MGSDREEGKDEKGGGGQVNLHAKPRFRRHNADKRRRADTRREGAIDTGESRREKRLIPPGGSTLYL